jgi:hypothetical protein
LLLRRWRPPIHRSATPIRLNFDNLEENKRPASEDPLFSELWRDSGGEEQILDRTIRRWRAQGK